LYQNNLQVSLNDFKTFLFLEMTVYGNELCFSGGWGVEEILLYIWTTMQFWDCYKNIIYQLCNFQEWWNNNLLDACGFSTDAQITLNEYNPITTETLYYWFGSSSYSTYCNPGKVLSPAATSLIFNVIAPYFN